MKRLDPSIRTSALYQQQPSWGVDGDTLWLGRKEPSPWLGGIRLSDCGGSVIEAAHKAGAHILSPYYREIGAADVKHAHSLAMKVVSWTINEKEDMERELDKGVDGMISDRPALLRQVLTAGASRSRISSPARIRLTIWKGSNGQPRRPMNMAKAMSRQLPTYHSP